MDFNGSVLKPFYQGHEECLISRALEHRLTGRSVVNKQQIRPALLCHTPKINKD